MLLLNGITASDIQHLFGLMAVSWCLRPLVYASKAGHCLSLRCVNTRLGTGELNKWIYFCLCSVVLEPFESFLIFELSMPTACSISCRSYLGELGRNDLGVFAVAPVLTPSESSAAHTFGLLILGISEVSR